jgi:hypothetical protein
MALSFAVGREGLHREGDRTARRSTGSQERKFLGTHIRHGPRIRGPVDPGQVRSLPVTVVKTAFVAALVPGVGGPSRAQTSLALAGRAAVGLASVVLLAHEEPGATDSAEKLV